MARAKYFDPITETWRYADEAMAGPAYTLPIAGEKLGGVRGPTPTAEQTETAGIDENGNIKYKAGGGVTDEYVSNNFANAYKKSMSGKIISSSVSPIEHDATCVLSSETITDFSSETVTIYGGNLVNNPGEFTEYKVIPVNLPAGVYTISTSGISSTDTDFTESGMDMKYQDNSGSGFIRFQRNIPAFKVFTAKKPIKEIWLYASTYYAPSQRDTATWNDLQLNAGDKPFPYSAYIEPHTYTATADGTIDGIRLKKTFNLFTNNAAVTAKITYNGDTTYTFANILGELSEGKYKWEVIKEFSPPAQVTELTENLPPLKAVQVLYYAPPHSEYSGGNIASFYCNVSTGKRTIENASQHGLSNSKHAYVAFARIIKDGSSWDYSPATYTQLSEAYDGQPMTIESYSFPSIDALKAVDDTNIEKIKLKIFGTAFIPTDAVITIMGVRA